MMLKLVSGIALTLAAFSVCASLQAQTIVDLLPSTGPGVIDSPKATLEASPTPTPAAAVPPDLPPPPFNGGGPETPPKAK